MEQNPLEKQPGNKVEAARSAENLPWHFIRGGYGWPQEFQERLDEVLKEFTVRAECKGEVNRGEVSVKITLDLNDKGSHEVREYDINARMEYDAPSDTTGLTDYRIENIFPSKIANQGYPWEEEGWDDNDVKNIIVREVIDSLMENIEQGIHTGRYR